jgi:hypothetical protein
MSLQDLVNVQISAATVTPSRPGFGTPLIAAYHTKYTDRVRFYSSLAGVGGDFAATDWAYVAASVAFAQNPAPAKVAIGRRALAMTQTVNLTLGSTSNLDTYTLTLVGSDGVLHKMDFASTGVTATDAASLRTAINALANVGTATITGSTVTVTQAAGKLTDYQNWNPLGSTTPLIVLADVTADPGLATDLNAIKAAALPGTWYDLALDSNSLAEINAAATWTESAGSFIFGYNNSDTLCITTSAADVFSVQKNVAHARAYGLYANSQMLCYSGLAWAAKTLPQNPGSLTFMYKTLASVPADNLSATAQTNLDGKNANYYMPIAGINTTINGWAGAGEYIDITWGVDALTAQIQIDVFALLASSPKVPYTDLGVDLIKSVVLADLNLFASPQYSFIAPVPAPTVSAPVVATIASSTRATRVFPGVTFQGQLAGAIHKLTIRGVLTA